MYRQHWGRVMRQMEEGTYKTQRFHATIRKRQDEGESGPADCELEHRVEAHRAVNARAEACDGAVAQRQSAHERSKHDARRPDGIAERDPSLMEPEILEEQRSGAGQEEYDDQWEEDHGRPTMRTSRASCASREVGANDRERSSAMRFERTLQP